MDAVFLISLIVGGFFVLMSVFGGGDADADADLEMEGEFDLDGDMSGTGFVDLLSVRTLFFFLAFFGLTGVLLGLTDMDEFARTALAVMTGAVCGFGGNYLIKTIGYRHVSSTISVDEMKGMTAKVVVPFTAADRGRIALEARGHRIMLSARAFDDEAVRAFEAGDEVVVVRLDGSVAEVIRPD